MALFFMLSRPPPQMAASPRTAPADPGGSLEQVTWLPRHDGSPHSFHCSFCMGLSWHKTAIFFVCPLTPFPSSLWQQRPQALGCLGFTPSLEPPWGLSPGRLADRTVPWPAALLSMCCCAWFSSNWCLVSWWPL